MDKRGLTLDPNAEAMHPAWYETLGPSQQPSPYATASWAYRHDWVTEEEAALTTEPIEYEFDNGDSFSNPTPGDSLDEAFFNTPRAGALILDEGGFSQTGDPVAFKKRYFGSVKVYDTFASFPNPSRPEQRVIQNGSTIGYTAVVVDVAGAVVKDNGQDILNPNPNLSEIYNSQTYPRSALGQVLDEMSFSVTPSGVQEIVNLNAPEGVDYDDDDVPRGTLLGEVYYEISGSNLTITDWSHYNWHDATPVRKAVKILLKEKPDCAEIVMVENRPSPFWRGLGFEYPFKGSEMLIHRNSLDRVSTY